MFISKNIRMCMKGTFTVESTNWLTIVQLMPAETLNDLQQNWKPHFEFEITFNFDCKKNLTKALFLVFLFKRKEYSSRAARWKT